MTETSQVSLSYQKVLDGLLRMHELFVAGQRRSEEVKRLRDDLDEPYADLTEVEREELEGLSKDLFDVEKIASEPVLEHLPLGDAAMMAATEALRSGHYDEALNLLRESKSIPASRISFFRGRNWSEKGQPKVALLFFSHAAKLNPRNDHYKAQVLEALVLADSDRGQQEITKILSEPPKGAPAVIIKACDLAFNSSLARRDEDRIKSLYEAIVRGLHTALTEMQEGPTKKLISESQPIYSYLYSMLATCCRHLDRVDPAYFYYTFAIGLDPFNDALFAARGALMYGRTRLATQTAAEDFDRAVKLGTTLIIPYYYLAHFFLNGGDFDRCLTIIDAGLKIRGSKRLKSEMLEFKAIAFAAMRRSPELVKQMFKEAALTDETNKRVLSNLAIYEFKKGIAAPSATERFLLKIDLAMVQDELPNPPSLRETEKALHKKAG